MGFILDQIMDWLVTAILACFDAVIDVIAKGLLVTPDVTALPQVQALTGRSVWIVDTVFVLAFVAAGALTMAAGGDERSRYTAKDLLPRLIVGFIAAHFSPQVCSGAIEVANALTAALSADQTGELPAATAMRSHLHAAAANHAAPLLFAIIAAIITVLVAATAFSLMVRMSVLLVLSAIAPIALALHALPQTDPAARLWWRSFTGCLITPILQAFTLMAGQWMLLDPRHLLPELAVPGDPGSTINLLIVVVLLWTTVKIPGLVGRYVIQPSRGPNVIGAIVRVVVVQQLTRGLRIPGVRVRAVTR